MERPQRNGQASKLADHFVERLHGWAEVSIRSLFGSIALCREEIVFALVWQGELYLKADTSTRATFEAEGSRTLTYISKGKSASNPSCRPRQRWSRMTSFFMRGQSWPFRRRAGTAGNRSLDMTFLELLNLQVDPALGKALGERQ